jgi:nucleoside 2-deoxyribosyltransferase
VSERYAFVLTQIGADGSAERSRTDQVTKYIIKPVCKEKGLDALRADRDPTPGRITNQVVRHIVESDVVIADLTGRNANVYYELGIAHSFNRPVILLVDDPDMLVFDTKDERVIRLGPFSESLSAEAAEQGQQELRKALDVV